MLSGKRVISYILGSPPKLKDLRQIVAETTSVNDDAVIEFVAHEGQRDAVNVEVIITESVVPRDTARSSIAEQRGD
jgi:hypothetical protein